MIEREDIYELNELSKVIKFENIPFKNLMDAFSGFICDVLIANDSFQNLNIDSKTETVIINYALQGKAFLDKSINNTALEKARISAWKTHDGFVGGSAAKNLLRIVICSLYDEDAAEYDTQGSEMPGVIFSLLLDLGKGYCKQFRYYLQENLVPWDDM